MSAKKHVLITGSSTGIGYAAAEELCRRGHQVWAGVRKPDVLDRLKERFPKHLHILQLDVTSEEDIQNAKSEITSHILHNEELILINNAGIAIGGPIESLRQEDWKEIFEVNFFAAVNMTHHFLPLLRKTKGRVINIGSISGRIATPFLGPYVASKFALRAFTDSLRREISRLGVQVILIEAGPIRTEIWEKSFRASEVQEQQLSPELRDTYGEAIDKLKVGVSKAAQQAVPVQEVTKCLVAAIESKHADTSYLVGKAIHVQAFLGKHLPPIIMDKMINYGFHFQKGTD